jgi:hypothetical protein
MGDHPVAIRLYADMRAYPPGARHLLGSAARQIGGLRAGLIRLLGPYTELAHGK